MKNNNRIIIKQLEPERDSEGEMVDIVSENDIINPCNVPLRLTYEFDHSKFQMVEA